MVIHYLGSPILPLTPFTMLKESVLVRGWWIDVLLHMLRNSVPQITGGQFVIFS